MKEKKFPKGHKHMCSCCVCKSIRGEIKHLPEEQKRKIGEGNKGKVVTLETRLKMSKRMKKDNPMNNPESREKISESLRGMIGPQSRNWKGGINTLNWGIRNMCKSKQIEWRDNIYKRDNYTCQICRDSSFKGRGKSVRLEGHHIKSFSDIIKNNNITSTLEGYDCDELWDINNGITLCKECHKLVHQTNVLDFQ